MHPVSGPQLNPSRKSPIENLVRKITTKITPRCKVHCEFLNLLRTVFILPLPYYLVLGVRQGLLRSRQSVLPLPLEY